MEQQSEQVPRVHEGLSSVDNNIATNGPDMSSMASNDSKRTDLLGGDLGVHLEINFKLLENRVCSLKQRLPLIEQSTTFLQSMLSNNISRDRSKILGSNSEATVFDTSAASSDSETLTGSSSHRGLSESTKMAHLGKELRTLLPKNCNIRIPFEAPSKAAHSTTFSKEMNAPSDSASSGSGKARFNESFLNEETLYSPGEFDHTGYLFDAQADGSHDTDLIGVWNKWRIRCRRYDTRKLIGIDRSSSL